MKKVHILLFAIFLGISTSAHSQFHTLKIPQPSPKVIETQRLGVTDITIDYSSPATRGRDVWNTVVGSYGDPNLAWRAGANMNTRISFSTDVTINGESLAAGSYGFHVDIDGENCTLMFAHHDNQWGSYYLDRENHISLSTTVQTEACPPSVQLDYEFINRTDSSLVIALEWGEKRIPFTVAVDLNKTVLSSFRYELLGINTYRWEAWNDAARWCLRRNTNLEEALEWANRSINGGYNGFSANRNPTNMTTRAQILHKLDRVEELDQAIADIAALDLTALEVNDFSRFLMRIRKPELNMDVLNANIKKYPDAWWLKINRALTFYFLDNAPKAAKELRAALSEIPESYHPKVNEIIKEVENGTYKMTR